MSRYDDGVFLEWVSERLVAIHGEDENLDFIRKLNNISKELMSEGAIKMNKPDWSKAPKGATHWRKWESCAICWLKELPPSYWDYDKWQEYADAEFGKRHLSEAIPRPPKKQKKHERIAELLKGKAISGLTIGEANELVSHLRCSILIVDTSE